MKKGRPNGRPWGLSLNERNCAKKIMRCWCWATNPASRHFTCLDKTTIPAPALGARAFIAILDAAILIKNVKNF